MSHQLIIIGAGHAGIEAALSASRMGIRTLLITSQADTLGLMPCNPAIGGLAKSHLVCELDALGGEMGINTDMTGIQFRVLNRSRGPAVQANRVQCDKQLYTCRIQQIVRTTPNLTLLEDSVLGVETQKPREITAVFTGKHGRIPADAFIFTVGTALTGTIWVGHQSRTGAGDGRPAIDTLQQTLKAISPDITFKRLKTGTPPRIKTQSIRFEAMIRQDGETEPVPFFSQTTRTFIHNPSLFKGLFMKEADPEAWQCHEGYATYRTQKCSTWNTDQTLETTQNVPRGTSENPQTANESVQHGTPSSRSLLLGSTLPGTDQKPCYFTHTTTQTHQIVTDNLSQSSLYGGNISGTGVRYCPSFEDKVVKFTSRDEHHVILEPEGRNCPWMYPNGLSNSLPLDIQLQMVHSVPGLEVAEFAAPGYAIEYDAIDSRALTHALALRDVPNLFFAGQINGTTGYEEAAAQGFIAGVNAARYLLGKAPLVFARHEAYIGVMIDDLVTKGSEEPYRMFTSRAERRLLLRQGNAALRLLPHAQELGILLPEVRIETEGFQAWLTNEQQRLSTEHLSGIGATRAKYLARPEVDYLMASGGVDATGQSIANLPQEWRDEIAVTIKYAGYIEHEERAAQQLLSDERILIPADIDYMTLEHLRYEAREKLTQIRPETLGQAARIPGVNPADIAILAVILRRR